MHNNFEKYSLLIARVLTVAIPLLLVTGRAAADAAILLIALLFIVRSIVTRDGSWLRATWVRLGFALWLWMLLISIFAFDVRLSYMQAVPWLRFLLFAVALEVWVLNAVWIRRLVISATGMLIFVAVDAWWQYFTGFDFFQHPRPGATRLTGPFDDLRVGIYLVKLMFPAFLGFAAWHIGKKVGLGFKLFLGISVLVVIGAVFVSGERTAFLLLMFGLFLAAVLQKGALRAAVVGVLILGAVGIGVVSMADRAMLERQSTSVVTTLSTFRDSPYGELWRSALLLGSERPWTGVGMKNFRVACKDPHIGLPADVMGRCGTHPHNLYLEWFAESGVPGLILFLLMLAALAKHLWQGWQMEYSRVWMVGPVIAVIIQLWPIATTASFFSNWSGALMWLAIGWALAAARGPAYNDQQESVTRTVVPVRAADAVPP